MRPNWLLPALAAVLFGCSTDTTTPVSGPAFSKGGANGGGTPKPMPVTSTVADIDPGVAPALQIRSDGVGTYTNSSTLTSEIQVIGDWVLDALNPRGATRRVYLDFSQPIPGTGPNGGDPVAPPSGLYAFRMISRCSQNGDSFLTLAPGATVSCPLQIRFTDGGGDFAIQMNPNPDYSPETDFAFVTCVEPALGPGPCAQWTITPSGTFSGGYRNVARLIQYVTTKGHTRNVDQGDFYVSFRIGVTSQS